MPKKKPDKEKPLASPTALTAEGRENQVIAMAYDLAEKKIRDGTASSQLITHFLKMGSPKERIERSILEEQRKLIVAKTEAVETSKELKEVYNNALKAMQLYSGNAENENVQ